MKTANRKIVIINQAVNYLTIGICNEFANKFKDVALITGSIHEQGEALDPRIHVSYITKWKEEHGFRKAFIYIKATLQIYWLLVTKFRRHEVFFISLPPMGYLLNILVGHKFSMLLWDVYPDVFKITGMKSTHPFYSIWAYFNKKSFKRAHKIFTIGENVKQALAQYVNEDKIIISPIWSIFENNANISKSDNSFISEHNLDNKFVVQYSGNIGLTHNVEILVEVAKKMQQHQDILFQIIGRGPRKKLLEKRVLDKQIRNCKFLPFQSDEMFPYSLRAADVGVVILDKKASKGSVPSKSYNLMSYGIPSLYIASKDSELNSYVVKYKHAKCFAENELDEIEKFILQLKNDKNYYDLLSTNSTRASEDFKRSNAIKLVDSYISN